MLTKRVNCDDRNIKNVDPNELNGMINKENVDQ